MEYATRVVIAAPRNDTPVAMTAVVSPRRRWNQELTDVKTAWCNPALNTNYNTLTYTSMNTT